MRLPGFTALTAALLSIVPAAGAAASPWTPRAGDIYEIVRT